VGAFSTFSSEESALIAAAAHFVLPFAAAAGGGGEDKARVISTFLFLVKALVARMLVPVLRKGKRERCFPPRRHDEVQLAEVRFVAGTEREGVLREVEVGKRPRNGPNRGKC